MRNALFLVLSVCLSFAVSGQIDTVAIQKRSKKVPRSESQDPVRLANYLTSPYSDDASKVIAISYWIANNIIYDYRAFMRRGVTGPSIDRILRRKRAVCEGYARLFDELCKQSGIQSVTINGHIHEWDHFADDTIIRDEHAWSAALVNGKWELMDIAWGSCKLTPKRQWFRRLLFFWFKIPYKQKMIVLKSYDPQWFFVDPRKMALSHHPNIDAFQLLSNPVPIDTFENGWLPVSEHINRYSEVQANNFGINDYLARDKMQQWELEGNRGLKNNPNNRRVRGFDHFLMADSLYRSWYDEKEKLLLTDTMNLIRMGGYIAISDSMFKLNKHDNNREFAIKKRRSEQWKKERIANDNAYFKALLQRKTSNKKLIKSTLKIDKDNERLLSHQKRQMTRFKKGMIRRIVRPEKEMKGKEKRIADHMAASDSLWKLAQSLIPKKDSLFAVYSQADVAIRYEREAPMPDLYKQQADDLKAMLKFLKKFPIMIHGDEFFTVKPFYVERMRYADSIYNYSTKPFYEQLVKNQADILVLMRRYDALVSQSLQALVSAKSLSFKSLSEDSIYAARIDLYLAESQRLLPQIKGYKFDLSEFNKLLSKEINPMDKIRPMLQTDKRLEFLRHGSYMRYRSYMKKAENARAAYFLSELRKYDALRKKSIRAERRKAKE